MNYPNYTYSDELYHHGILGQKWGVRRYQNSDGTLTEAGKKRKYGQRTLRSAYGEQHRKTVEASVGTRVGLAAAGASWLATPIASVANPIAPLATITGAAASLALVNKINDNYTDYIKSPPTKTNELLIKKGDTFVRTSLKAKEDGKSRIYVTYSKAKEGKKTYETSWGKMLRKFANDPDAPVYQNTYKVKTDIVAPSLERRKQAAQAIFDADKKMKTELGRAYAMDQLLLETRTFDDRVKTVKDVEQRMIYSDTKRRVKEFYDAQVKEITKQEKLDLMNDDTFRKFTASIPKSEKLMNAYINELKKNGFNAVFDDNAGNASSAFIVFDQNVLEQTGSKDISKNFDSKR